MAKKRYSREFKLKAALVSLAALALLAHGCSPSGAKAQVVHAWDEAPRFSGFSFTAF